MAWRNRTSIVSDVRYGARLLLRQRGFAAVAILTTALGIGVTATLFSVFDAVLLRPLPWPRGDRLIRLTETHAGATREMPLTITNSAYLAMDRLSTVDSIGAWSRTIVTITADGTAERVPAMLVTPGSFAMLRAAPAVGRVFTADDADEIVLSYGYWIARFGGALDAVGRTITMNGFHAVIVGVMPPDFAFPDRDTRVWRPLKVPRPPAFSMFGAMARLADGVTPEQAAVEMTARARAAAPSTNTLLAVFGSAGAAQIIADPALAALTRDVRPGVIALFASGVLLLVMAVANLASLELARAATRYREMAIRSALGAGTERLVQHLLVEQLLLALAGGALGLALTYGLHRTLPALLPADFPRLQDIAVRIPVVLVTFGLAGFTAVVLGTVPAWHLRRLRLTEALGDGASGSIGGTRQRGRAWIMSGQIAIASALLVVALLLGRSFEAMLKQDRGFDPAHLVTARLSLPDSSFTPQARIEAVEQFVARARALPGAPRVAVTTALPLSGSEYVTGFDMPSVRPPAGVTINVHAVRAVVTPDYVRAIGLRLLAGRDFRQEDDSPSAQKVVIVNRSFARQYLTERAVGDHIQNFMNRDGIAYEVIGVVEDMQRKALTERIQPEIYSLLRQSPRPASAQDVIMRTAVQPAVLADPLRRLVGGIAPQASIDSVRSMDDRIAGSLARPRLYAVLLVAFAGSAVLIAAVGLVGVLSYTVAQRAREIALRVALGARPAQVLALVFSQGLTVTAAGVTTGLIGAFAAARYLSTLLYGISSGDAVSFLAAPATLAIVALAACTAPALRAMRIDPLTKLRG